MISGSEVLSTKSTFFTNVDGTTKLIIESDSAGSTDSTIYNYAEGKKSVITTYRKENGQLWSLYSVENYSYTSDKIDIFEQTFYNNGGSSFLQDNYEYSNFGEILVDIRSSKDAANQPWALDEKYNYYYSSKQQLDSIVQADWNSLTSSFQPYLVEKYTYNDNGQVITITSLNLNNTVSTNDYKREVSYDNSGNVLSFTDYRWDNTGKVWKNTYKIDCVTSTQYNWKNTFIPYDNFQQFFPNSAIETVKYYSWNMTNSQWEQSAGSNIYYSPMTTVATQKHATKTFNIFPNPTNDILNIISPGGFEEKTITIKNSFGTEVISEMLNGMENIVSLPGLPNRIYLLSILSNGKTFSDKIIVQ